MEGAKYKKAPFSLVLKLIAFARGGTTWIDKHCFYRDFKRRPPLTPLAIKYIAVVVFCVSHLCTCLYISLAYNKTDLFAFETDLMVNVLKFISKVGKISVPLMLSWMLAQVLSSKENVWKLVIFYGAASILFYIGENLFLIYYFVPRVQEITTTIISVPLPKDIILSACSMISNLNVFLDLFLCSAVYFFAMYTPKRIKSKAWLIIFRCCTALSLAYILTAFIIEGLQGNGVIYIDNVYILSLLPSKGVINFVIFGLMMTFTIIRKSLYNKLNRSEVTYEEYEKTNRYVINYSIVASLIFAISAGIDSLLGLVPSLSAMGFGNNIYVLFAIPFLLLHDFTAKPKTKYSVLFTGPIYAVTFITVFAVYLSLVSSIINVFVNAMA